MELLKKAWSIFDKRQKRNIFWLLIAIFIGTALETVGVAAIVPFITAIMNPEKLLENKLLSVAYDILGLQNTTQLIILLAVGLMLVYIAKNAYLCFMYHLQFKFVYGNQKRLATRLMTSYLRQPYSYHLNHNSAEFLHNITQDVDTFFLTVLYCINLITDVMVCFALAIVLFITDKSITIGVAVLTGAVIFLFYKGYKKKLLDLGEEKRDYYTKSTKTIQQAFGGVKELKVFGRENFFIDTYDGQYGKYTRSRRKVSTYSMMPKPVMETVSVCALLLVVSLKLASGVNVGYFIPTLSVFALAVIRMLPSSSRISSNISNISYGRASVEVIYNDLLEVAELETKISKNTGSKIQFTNEILLQDVSFHYDNNEKQILDKVSIQIPKNASIAFVGPSGAGKTTLADIVLGVLECQQGQILVDGVDIKSNYGAWQKEIGYIPQNIFIMDDTIRRNIAFALKDEDIDDERIWKVLKEAQLSDFVENLPDGLDTVIGERGSRISGGQRQRIGIARALYHDPAVLVLDEATSALDQETESAVMEAIDSLNGLKTMIIIAHRLTTIENCDIVYRIENGKAIIEKKK